MAIQGKVSIKGVTLPSAYVQVVRTWGGTKDGGLQALIRVYADKDTRDANSEDFIIEKNLREQAAYISGQDGLATVYAHLIKDVIAPAVDGVPEVLAVDAVIGVPATDTTPEIVAVEGVIGRPAIPAIPAVTGEFVGFVSC